MTKKMLIDAAHPEETRVVIVDGTQVEELDFESRDKRQLRGNVYLARVTRVEPSLQAAFIEYGGNRHGFLAFSEIHPDYYQIPYEDRMALIEAEEAENIAEDEAEEEEALSGEAANDSDDDEADDIVNENDDDIDTDNADNTVDEDVVDEQAKVASSRRKRMSRRRYKIQEVIKRGQILLVQAVKEERGNKGAAMTTYLSLAGRYCVLMPNTPRGGGISRKISNGTDRKRLKTIMSELKVPQGMGVIVRTAGAKRTKAEIKRDYEYLSRLWSEIRETTLKSTAPALIHEEGNLVKRSIRDLYNKDISEVLVQGDEAYKTAKAFIKMLMPSHAKNVKQYKDPIPLYLRYQVERQIEASLDSVVQLKSGGYLVIHPTEALVSVDVNSGRSTRERNVERTALKTNLEATDEVARQMRLRDLAGLIVIDFIDMDESRNNRSVEKRMKDALARDRARVQTSRISQFGLMEISRQRRRRSLLEGSTASCEHCDGVGRKRTIESSALRAMRAVEEIGIRGRANRIRLKVSSDVALYLFNEKRGLLQHVDGEFDMFTEIMSDKELIRPAFEYEVIEAADTNDPDPLEEIEAEWKKQRQLSSKSSRGRRRGKKSDDDSDDKGSDENEAKSDDKDDNAEPKKRRRRRGRRGGRGKRKTEETPETSENETSNDNEGETSGDVPEALKVITPESSEDTAQKEKPKRRGRRKAPTKKVSKSETTETDVPSDDVASEKPAAKKRTTRNSPARKAKETESEKSAETEISEEKPKRKSTARRKAPPKKADAPDDASSSERKAKPKSKSTRRKAPAKKADPKKEVAKKTPSESDNTETGTKEDAKFTTARSTTRRKAPARKSAPEADKNPKSKRKPAAKKAPPAKETSETDPKHEDEAKPAPKKRGWWSRKKS